MRRRAGIGAVQKQKLEQERYKDKGTELQENQLDQMTRQMEVLREKLEEFASKHKNQIRKNALFRRQFQQMCASIGVDPLASGKGFWSVLNLGDFYYELSVQRVEVCLATSEKNGGLIRLEELRDRLVRARGKSKQHQEITEDDLLCAARKLKVFGNGLNVVPVGKGRYMVESVPGELSMDQTQVVSLVSQTGHANVSVSGLMTALNWESRRVQKVLDAMLRDGLVWLDLPPNSAEPLYWFPSFFTECIAA